jgi:hypothetical protein
MRLEIVGMTALAGGTVQQTFSAGGGSFTGLPRPKTHQPQCQDFGDFVEPFVGRKLVRIGAVRHQVHPPSMALMISHGRKVQQNQLVRVAARQIKHPSEAVRKTLAE